MDKDTFLLVAAQNTQTLNIWYADTAPYTILGLTVPINDIQGNSVVDYLRQVEVLTVEVNEGDYKALTIESRVALNGYYFFEVSPQDITNPGDQKVLGSTTYISLGAAGLDFENSVYNAIQGTAEIQRQSDYIMQSDRASGTLKVVGGGLPTNIDNLQSGSATKAYVQDSLYSDTGWTRARYDGTPTTRLTYGGIDPAIQGNAFQGSYFTRTTLDSRILSQSESDLVYTSYLFTGNEEVPKYETVDSSLIGLIGSPGSGSTVINVAAYVTSSILIGDLIRVGTLGGEVFKITSITIGTYPTQSLTVIRSWDPIPKSPVNMQQETTTLHKIKPVQIFKLSGNKIQPESGGKIKIKQTGDIIYTDPLGFIVSRS